jgi:Peptidase family M28
MNAREEIEALAEFDGRGPGTDAERRAAGHLAERLHELGRDADTEAIEVYPSWPLTYAIHVALAVIGSVISVTVPVLGALLVLIAVVLTFLDAIGLALTTRRLLGRRSSQNVISLEGGDKAGDLYLVAHYDAGRGGLLFNSTLQERRAALGKLLRRDIGPLQPLFWAMVALLVCVLIRLPGIDNKILTFVQFAFTVVLILALPLLLDTALARPTPGANDNASGVATALRLAERFGGKLEHLDLNLLLTGSQEAMSLGMRAFMKKRKGKLDTARTIFLNLDEVGRGTVRFTTREGLLLPLKSHDQLVSICEEIAEDAAGDEDEDEDDDTPVIRPMVARTTSDGYAARSAGLPAITITCKGRLDYTPGHHQPSDLPERIDDEALERAYEFTAELIERLDQTVGPDLDRPAEETVLKEDD